MGYPGMPIIMGQDSGLIIVSHHRVIQVVEIYKEYQHLFAKHLTYPRLCVVSLCFKIGVLYLGIQIHKGEERIRPPLPVMLENY
ncbi:hypothetical protein WKV44_06610 [Spirochaetia bacterium 38H-sp]|uniref:Uncharacterized protein n=1 Tax=Rarispira pelagica TaxID=3141764 RepID=A0ABU9UCI3_9SPIR